MASLIIYEVLLGAVLYSTPELRQSREAPKCNTPLDVRLWVQAAVIVILSYIAMFLNKSTNDGKAWLGRFSMGLAIGTVYFHVSAIALGASFESLANRTLAWSIIMSSMSVAPLAVQATSIFDLTLPPFFQLHQGFKAEKISMCRVQSLATVLGAWLGATFVPLDWAMPFQEWPLPPLVGAVLGHNVATVLATLVIYRSESEDTSLVKKR